MLDQQGNALGFIYLFSCVIPSMVRSRDTVMKLKTIISDLIYYALFILILFFLFGCEYRYRYPCQDPANWKKTECNNEICEIEKTCTYHVTNMKLLEMGYK